MRGLTMAFVQRSKRVVAVGIAAGICMGIASRAFSAEDLTSFDRCFDLAASNNSQLDCHGKLDDFVKSHPNDVELSYNAGVLLIRHHVSPWMAVPYFTVVIKKPSDHRCEEGDVRDAVLAGLALSSTEHKTIVDESVELASQVCWATMKTDLRAAFNQNSGFYRQNACPFLKAKKALSSLQAKICDSKK